MKGFALYRILTLLVNVICTIFGMGLFFFLGVVFTEPGVLLQFLVLLAVMLYAWHANRFLLKVLIKKELSTRKHRDWLQVNAIVTVIFSAGIIFQSISIMNNPTEALEIIKQFRHPNPKQLLENVSIVMLVVAGILLAHVAWTYFLIRRHKEYFINENI
ncbi:hypothetical protein [Foetidibacter luteolus]|uniref:hypothetical protein n=1 Tax=Foetidibacter luteolus TaxID=2608880 RepID=UPI00129ABC1B|nr:hypothetical protein [Foetidibacter luteolus]